MYNNIGKYNIFVLSFLTLYKDDKSKWLLSSVRQLLATNVNIGKPSPLFTVLYELLNLSLIHHILFHIYHFHIL